MYLKVFDKDLPNNLDISQQDENDFSPVGNIVDHEEDFEIQEDFDHFDDHISTNFNTEGMSQKCPISVVRHKLGISELWSRGFGDLLWRLPMGFGAKPRKIFAIWHIRF